jgi:hypothetical protein
VKAIARELLLVLSAALSVVWRSHPRRMSCLPRRCVILLARVTKFIYLVPDVFLGRGAGFACPSRRLTNLRRKGNMLMNKLFLVLSALSLSALAQPFPPYVANASAPRSSPPRLEGMDYLHARRIILGFGWQPVTGPCGGISVDCARFPEIDTCSCCEQAPCGMFFRRRNWCLIVGTIGGPPIVGHRDSQVADVYFRRGHCSKPR